MINRTDIAPGTTVYTARRGLEARHDILFTVQERVVQKRTPKGYAIQSPYFRNGMRYLDADYYISTSKEEVAKALMADADVQIKQLQAQIEHMVQAKIKLWASYPSEPETECDHRIEHHATYRICTQCGKEWPV